MAASSSTVDEVSAPKRLTALGKVLFFAVLLLVAFILFKASFRPDDPNDHLWWVLLAAWLSAGALFYIFVLAEPDGRLFYILALLTLVLAAVVAAFVQTQIVTNPQVIRTIRDSGVLSFLLGGFVESVVWATLIGVIVALLVIWLPLLLVGYAAGAYLLALHKDDGVRRRDAIRYVLSPLLSTNQPFILVENGQALTTKDSGKITAMGGPGKLIVKQGNVVVLERAGKITRIVNAGPTRLEPRERIRNIFSLASKTKAVDVERVLTRDRIPLKINLGVTVRIEPAAEAEKRPESRVAPDGEALTDKLDDGLYRVYEGTIRKAALMSQATSFAKREVKKCVDEECQDVVETAWQDVVGKPPQAQLRDHIMSHRFDELFELVESAPGEKPEVRVKKRKIAEIEQAILEDIKPGRIKHFGVLVMGVDIGKIIFPKEARDLLLGRWSAPWQQQVDLIGTETEVQGRLLEAQSGLDTAELQARAGVTRAELTAKAIVIRARARAQARILEGQGEGEARAAFFREVLQEMKKEKVLEDPEVIALVLRQLINTMVTVQDLQAYVKLAGLLEPLSRGQFGVYSRESEGNSSRKRHSSE